LSQALGFRVNRPGSRLLLFTVRPAVYFFSQRASPAFFQYQIILLGDRGR